MDPLVLRLSCRYKALRFKICISAIRLPMQSKHTNSPQILQFYLILILAIVSSLLITLNLTEQQSCQAPRSSFWAVPDQLEFVYFENFSIVSMRSLSMLALQPRSLKIYHRIH